MSEDNHHSTPNGPVRASYLGGNLNSLADSAFLPTGSQAWQGARDREAAAANLNANANTSYVYLGPMPPALFAAIVVGVLIALAFFSWLFDFTNPYRRDQERDLAQAAEREKFNKTMVAKYGFAQNDFVVSKSRGNPTHATIQICGRDLKFHNRELAEGDVFYVIPDGGFVKGTLQDMRTGERALGDLELLQKAPEKSKIPTPPFGAPSLFTDCHK